jgi:nucleotide-binding universal stress UspA family protein
VRVLCGIGQRNGSGVVRRVLEVVGMSPDLLIVHVIDVRPRHDLERLAGPLRHGPLGGPSREYELSAAEEAAGHAALAEAFREAELCGLQAATRLEQGRPGEVIVGLARQAADLIAVAARDVTGRPASGPASVGHTARFVLDHAPCDVLLLRESPERLGRAQ